AGKAAGQHADADFADDPRRDRCARGLPWFESADCLLFGTAARHVWNSARSPIIVLRPMAASFTRSHARRTHQGRGRLCLAPCKTVTVWLTASSLGLGSEKRNQCPRCSLRRAPKACHWWLVFASLRRETIEARRAGAHTRASRTVSSSRVHCTRSRELEPKQRRKMRIDGCQRWPRNGSGCPVSCRPELPRAGLAFGRPAAMATSDKSTIVLLKRRFHCRANDD